MSITKSCFVRSAAALLLAAVLVLGILPGRARAASVTDGVPFWTCGDTEGTVILPLTIDGVQWLLLPSTADPTALKLCLPEGTNEAIVYCGQKSVRVANGGTVDLVSLCGSGEEYSLTVVVDRRSYSVRVRCSGTIAAMYLTSDDPVNAGRAWVESSADKSNKATGSMILQNADGTVVYNGALTQIKGRGNSTWSASKKPYQIKLDKKTDLLETGDSSNKNKTWVLLANYYDATMLRNAVAFDLAEGLDMDIVLGYRYVDLYYDGEYRGTYMLCEKVSIGSGRVDIHDLEEDNDEANEGIDYDDLTVLTGTTDNGAVYTYCEGMNNPDNISGGYLLEIEYESRVKEEVCWFRTTRDYYVVVKSPEYCSREEMEYIATRYQEMEDALYNNGVNPDTGKTYAEYMDLESAASCYLIDEVSECLDSFQSSAFLYKDAESDLFYMGPIWDYDSAFGYQDGSAQAWYVSGSTMGSVMVTLEDFYEEVVRLAEEKLFPCLSEIVLAEGESVVDGIHSLHALAAETGASAACNGVLWGVALKSVGSTYEQQMTYLREYLTTRTTWMRENIRSLKPLLFMDVYEGQWFYDYVKAVYDAGIMVGVGNRSFAPQRNLTRAEMAQILYNIEDNPSYTGDNPFADVSENSWFYAAVTWCREAGVMEGVGDNRCDPGANITREDAVVLLWRYLGRPAVTGTETQRFPDAGKIDSYAAAAMEWAVEEGVLVGSDGYLNPRMSITRAEIATILTRLFCTE